MKQLRTDKHIKRGGGYTIIELLFAVVNFSFVMMIALSAFVVVMRVYNKSAFMRQTQQISRTAIDRMANEIRLSTIWRIGPPPPAAPLTSGDQICLDIKSDTAVSARYARMTDMTTTRRKITREAFSGGGCTGSSLGVENVTPDDFDVTDLNFQQLIQSAGVSIDGLPKKGTGIAIDLTIAKGTVPTDLSDPFYNATTLNTFVNARGGS